MLFPHGAIDVALLEIYHAAWPDGRDCRKNSPVRAGVNRVFGFFVERSGREIH
jgi:hypothetical protein